MISQKKSISAASTIKNTRIPSMEDILNAVSHDKALVILRTISLIGQNSSNISRSKCNLSRKQYYSGISDLRKAGLIRGRRGKYSLTSLGKVVYYAREVVENAVNDFWKLKAIDSLNISDDNDLSKEELVKLVDSLIDNQEIKEIVLKTV
jgi:predicted transcriptional regulator